MVYKLSPRQDIEIHPQNLKHIYVFIVIDQFILKIKHSFINTFIQIS